MFLKIMDRTQLNEYAMPGITRIAWITTGHLFRTMTEMARGGLRPAVAAKINPVSFHGSPSCKKVTEASPISSVDKVTLEFESNDSIPTEGVAFIVTDANGRNFLIGAGRPPMAAVKAERSLGIPDQEKATVKYTVTHEDIISLYEVLSM